MARVHELQYDWTNKGLYTFLVGISSVVGGHIRHFHLSKKGIAVPSPVKNPSSLTLSLAAHTLVSHCNKIKRISVQRTNTKKQLILL